MNEKYGDGADLDIIHSEHQNVSLKITEQMLLTNIGMGRSLHGWKTRMSGQFSQSEILNGESKATVVISQLIHK